MTNLYYTVPYTTIHNLAEIGFIEGSYKEFDFNIYNSTSTSLLTIWGCTLTWSLYHLEDILDYPEIEKTVYPYSSTSFQVVLSSSDTEGLYGKFIQEVTITDYVGKNFTGGRGLVTILPSAL